MVCSMLAVQVARLDPNIIEELLKSEQLADALARWLTDQLGGRVVTVERQPNHLTLNSWADVVTVSKAGGLRLTQERATGLTTERIEKYLTTLVRVAVQARTVTALKAAYRVTKDTPLANGLRTLELEL